MIGGRMPGMKRMAAALPTERYDLLILGGGITGAGVALDAALRGFRVALIDKGDFASGTSSVSSKLVHGGIRYLEHGDILLVYEALHERRRLLQNAPHVVHPLRFIIPFYRAARMPPWKWRLGLTLYDLLAGRGNLRRSGALTRSRLRHEVPALRPEGLVGGADYFDAQMDDARLCLEVLRSAAGAGAHLSNYAEAIAFEPQQGSYSAVRVHDHVGGGELRVQARQVLNATGPWVDQICRLAGDPSEAHLRPTKGVHLVVANPGFSSAFLLLHPADGRVFFVIPWMGDPRHQDSGDPGSGAKLLIGTTDTDFAESPDQLGITEQDIDYLLQGYNHHFLTALSRNDVLGSFAGLRPLIRARAGEPSSTSREYRIFKSPSGLLSVAGGKYTTYRHMAEVITDRIARRLGRRRRERTQDYRLDGTPLEPWPAFAASALAALQNRHALPQAAARHLVQRYGRRAEDVARYLVDEPQLAQPVIAGEPDLRVEFRFHRDQEMAIRPGDYLLRRTRLGLFHPELLRQPGIVD